MLGAAFKTMVLTPVVDTSGSYLDGEIGSGARKQYFARCSVRGIRCSVRDIL